MQRAAGSFGAVVDGWLDGTPGARHRLDDLDDALAGVLAAEHSAPAEERAVLQDARRALLLARALAEASAEDAPLDAATSRRLEACEDALAAAAGRLGVSAS